MEHIVHMDYIIYHIVYGSYGAHRAYGAYGAHRAYGAYGAYKAYRR